MGDSDSFFQADFRDFDAFAEAVEDASFTFRCSALDSENWSVQGVYLPGGIHVQMVSEGGGNIADGVNPKSGGNIFMHRDGLMRVNGKELQPSTPFFMPPESEFAFANDHSHRWFSIYFPEPVMHDLGLNEDARGREYRRVTVIQSSAFHSNQIWRLCKRFLRSAAASSTISSGARSRARFESELVDVLRDGYGRKLETRSPNRGRPVVTDRLMVARAIDAIEATEDGRLPIEDLVQITGVSERSLRAGFDRYFGVSPKRFMQICMLNKARALLARARPDETTVTRIAADLGEWDIGRFAMRYKAVFGELPSETLRGNPGI